MTWDGICAANNCSNFGAFMGYCEEHKMLHPLRNKSEKGTTLNGGLN
jgi:hypothetical protein